MSSVTELWQTWQEGFANKDSSKLAEFLTDDGCRRPCAPRVHGGSRSYRPPSLAAQAAFRLF